MWGLRLPFSKQSVLFKPPHYKECVNVYDIYEFQKCVNGLNQQTVLDT